MSGHTPYLISLFFSRKKSEIQIAFTFFEKWKVKNKFFSLFFESWKWNSNGSRSRTRSENLKKNLENSRETRISLGAGWGLRRRRKSMIECFERCVMTGLPNQPRDNVTPIHTLWDNCRTRFEEKRFECGLRLPKALRAWFECRTRFKTYTICGSFYLTNQEIMSHQLQGLHTITFSKI